MMTFSQGDIVFVNLDPSLGNETKHKWPCLVISNSQYNRFFNTIMIIPISSATKYMTLPKYQHSAAFVSIDTIKVQGTALLQHVRTIDPAKRTDGKVVAKVPSRLIEMITSRIQQFF